MRGPTSYPFLISYLSQVLAQVLVKRYGLDVSCPYGAITNRNEGGNLERQSRHPHRP